MLKDTEEKKQITCMCKICSKRMKDEDIYSTVEYDKISSDSAWMTVSHLCSHECDLAFKLHTELNEYEEENGYIDAESVLSGLEIFNEWDKKDMKIAIDNLLINGSASIKEALVEYLDYAEEHGLLQNRNSNK